MRYDLNKTSDLNDFKFKVNKLTEKKVKVELKEVRGVRTLSQNRYLHVCITLYAINFGYTINEAKTMLKRECGFMTYKKHDTVFLVETSKQNTEELTKFIEWIRNYAAQNDCYIPSSEEFIENAFNIQRQIDMAKEYL